MSARKGIWKRIPLQIEPLQRSSHCLSVVGDNTACVFGGELEPRKPRDNVVYLIDLADATDSNTAAAAANTAHGGCVEAVSSTNVSSPSPRVGAASTSLGGRFYCFGGRGGVSMTCLQSNGSFDVFDKSTSSWSVMNPANSHCGGGGGGGGGGGDHPYPEDRSYHSMTSDNVDKIYLHAGCPAQGRLNDLWEFDTTTLKWRRLPSAPGGCGGGRGGASIAYSSTRGKGKLYRVNGFDGQVEQGGAVDVYDVDDATWSSVEYKPDGVEGPEPRSVATLVPVRTSASGGGELLVTMFGEGSPSDLGHAGAGRMFSDVWAFDTTTGKWHRVECPPGEPAPAGRGWFGADVWPGGEGEKEGDRVVIHGGLHDSNRRLDDMWVLQIL